MISQAVQSAGKLESKPGKPPWAAVTLRMQNVAAAQTTPFRLVNRRQSFLQAQEHVASSFKPHQKALNYLYKDVP